KGNLSFQPELKLFKNIILKDNEFLFGQTFVYFSNSGANSGKIFIKNNTMTKGRIAVNAISNDVVVSDNIILESADSGTYSLSVLFGNRIFLMRNLLGTIPYDVQNAIVGWNRLVDGGNPYASVGGSMTYLE